MPKEDDATIEQTSGGVKVLRANNVEIPLTQQTMGPENAEILKLRQAFFNGERLSPAELNKLMLRSMEGGGNGNCGIC